MANSDWYSPDLSASVSPAADENDGGSGVFNETFDVASERPAAPTPEDGVISNCSFVTWRRDYELTTAIVCGLYMVFALMCIFFGYRWEKTSFSNLKNFVCLSPYKLPFPTSNDQCVKKMPLKTINKILTF